METNETTLPVLAQRVSELAPDMGLDAFADALWKLDFIKERIRELDQQMKDKMIELIEASGGEIQIGPKKYWCGDEKKEKDKDVRQTAEAVLTIAAGDLDQFCTCLSSNAFKPGATKKLLGPEKFYECFETSFVKRLKTDGTEQKQLHVIDERFIR